MVLGWMVVSTVRGRWAIPVRIAPARAVWVRAVPFRVAPLRAVPVPAALARTLSAGIRQAGSG